MSELLKDLFSSDGFMPHGHCYLWNPALIWLHVVSDGFIALAYTTIPFTLLYFARKRRDIPFNWMFVCFGVFIVACGTTHVMEIWTLWTPLYWLSGIIKVITAIASVGTAILLIRLVPQAVAIPTPEQLQKAHDELSKAHAVLEERVEQRTAELTRKNEELARSEARFRRLVESGIVGIVISDVEGNIVETNDAFLSIVGYSREDLAAGKVTGKTLNTPERDETDAGAMAELRDHGSARPWEKELLRKDGTRVPVLSGVVVLDAVKREHVAFVLDLTERKRADEVLRESEELRRAKEIAEDANSELEAFSYSIAHDLRAPLRAIHGFSVALFEEHAAKLEDDAKGYLKRIISGAERMGHLIEALLGLARLTRAEPRREPVDLTGLAQKVMEQLRATEPSRKLDFVTVDGLRTEGDPQLLRSLLENLLGNAWKFTGKRSEARIEFGRDETKKDAPEFYVRDNGAGFDMSQANKLFAPFRRLHAAEDYEGTGIGLATVQRIVRRHGGKIWAEGTENEGATFHFTLYPRPVLNAEEEV